VQSSLTVAGNDSTSYKLIDDGTVRSLKTQSPLTLTANAIDKSLTIGGVPDPSDYATTAALNAKQEQLTFNGDDTVEGGFRLVDETIATVRRLVSGSRLDIQHSPGTLTLSVADSPTFTNLTVSNTLTAAAIAASNGITGTYQVVSSSTTLTRTVFGGAVFLATPSILLNYTVTLPPLTTGADILFLGPHNASVTVTLQGQGGININGTSRRRLRTRRG
jgi:hypothetical protein